MISVIIPNLNQCEELDRTLARLVPDKEGLEIIVADGGSIDGSLALIAARPWVKLVRAEGPRGSRMNAGAAAASGDVLLFLLPGIYLERQWPAAVSSMAARNSFQAGAFQLCYAGSHPLFRAAEWASRLRTILCRLPLANQALFVTRKTFDDCGGFSEQLVFEDAEWVQRLCRAGVRFQRCPLAAVNPVDRFERDGISIRMKAQAGRVFNFMRGAGPLELLESEYGERNAVIVQYQDDRKGSLKDVLAGFTGAERAEQAAQQLIRHGLRTAAKAPSSPRVLLAPVPEAAEQDFLGEIEKDCDLVFQDGKKTAKRMRYLFSKMKERAVERVLVVNPLCPALDEDRLGKAFAALNRHDLVIGPTRSGGFYLFGGHAGREDALQGLDFDRREGVGAGIEQAREAGLKVAVLPVLDEIDDEKQYRHYYHLGYFQE